MFTVIIGTIILTVLYALAWHNQPPRERENARGGNLRQEANPRGR